MAEELKPVVVCPRCGSETQVQMQMVVTFPSRFMHRLTRAVQRSREFQSMAALWDTASHICTNPNCGMLVKDSENMSEYRALRLRVRELEAEVKRLKDGC